MQSKRAKHPRLILPLIAALLAMPQSYAQVAEEQEVEAPAIYQVDLIVFRNVNASQQSTETWSTGKPEASSAADNPDSLSTFIFEPEPSLYYPSRGLTGPDFLLLDVVTEPQLFTLLPPDQTGLQQEFTKLEENPAYEPVVHSSWRQEVGSKQEAQAFDIANTGTLPAQLSGSLRLYKERYLHLEVHLELPDNAYRAFGYNTEALSFRIDQSRRLRGQKVQYFDHPKFGVIAFISEVIPPEPEEDELAGDLAEGELQSAR